MTVPIYKRLRFTMLFTVLLLVTLISGTSFWINYQVAEQKIEEDMKDEFLNTKNITETVFTFYNRQISLISHAVATDQLLGQAIKGKNLLAPAERLLALRQINGVDILVLLNQQGVIASSNREPGKESALPSQQFILQALKGNHLTSSLVRDDNRIILYGIAPLQLADTGKSLYVLAGYIVDKSFLQNFPTHALMELTVVSGGRIFATTSPADAVSLLDQIVNLEAPPAETPGNILERSPLGRNMYSCTLPIQGIEHDATIFLLLSHSLEQILASKKQISKHLALIFLVGLACSAILLFFVTGSILTPINRLKRLVFQISEGDLSDRVKCDVSNEFTPLIDQFNSMLDLVQKKDEELSGKVAAGTSELRQQNLFIDNLLSSSQVMAIAATDIDLKVTYFNPVAEKLFGYTADAVLGRNATEFHPRLQGKEEKFTAVLELVQHIGSHTFTIDRENDGIQATIEATLSPIIDQSGAPTGFMLMAHDISEARMMEERLRSALAELQVILDNTNLGLVLVRDDQIVQINSTVEKMFGYASDELTGSPWTKFHADIFSGNESECWDGSGTMFSLRAKAGTAAESEHRFWSKAQQVAINNDSPQAETLWLFEDISAQKEMFEKAQRLSQAVEQSSNSVVITNTSGIIEYVNKTFVKTTGYSAEEVIGQNPAILQSGKTPKAVHEDMWLALQDGREWIGEFVNKKKNGDFYEESVVVAPIRNEQKQITHFIATKENITDLKIARRQAESANQAKSDFLANMSHEIRTPMNAVIGMTELLLDTELDPEQEKYLNYVNSSASILLSLINDILDYSKIEAGKLELEMRPFNPRVLVDECVATLLVTAQQKGIELKTSISDEENNSLLSGDPLRLRQVLLNLMGNAIKFTQEGGVTLELIVEPEDADRCSVRFAIHDTGIGISPEQQKNIFEEFTQADNTISRNFGGTGLGLAISTRLVRLMGSSIDIDSAPGEGSVFSFTLHMDKDATLSFSAAPEKEINMSIDRHLHILLVEDNPANQELASILLNKEGHQVTVADNGLKALENLSKYEYDLVFMDMQMPVMDGVTATAHIRKFEQGESEDLPELAGLSEQLTARLAGCHTHIIAVTANAMQGDRQHCLDAGMDDYLSKPYKKIRFLQTLQKFDELGIPPVKELKDEPESVAPDATPAESGAISLAQICKHLIKDFGLEMEEAESVLEVYADSLKENLLQLQQTMDNGELVEGGRQAHALKGALLNLGLPDLADTAFILEKGLPKEITDEYKALVATLTEKLQVLTEKI